MTSGQLISDRHRAWGVRCNSLGDRTQEPTLDLGFTPLPDDDHITFFLRRVSNDLIGGMTDDDFGFYFYVPLLRLFFQSFEKRLIMLCCAVDDRVHLDDIDGFGRLGDGKHRDLRRRSGTEPEKLNGKVKSFIRLRRSVECNEYSFQHKTSSYLTGVSRDFPGAIAMSCSFFGKR